MRIPPDPRLLEEIQLLIAQDGQGGANAGEAEPAGPHSYHALAAPDTMPDYPESFSMTKGPIKTPASQDVLALWRDMQDLMRCWYSLSVVVIFIHFPRTWDPVELLMTVLLFAVPALGIASATSYFSLVAEPSMEQLASSIRAVFWQACGAIAAAGLWVLALASTAAMWAHSHSTKVIVINSIMLAWLCVHMAISSTVAYKAHNAKKVNASSLPSSNSISGLLY